jgi:hypothetical protein
MAEKFSFVALPMVLLVIAFIGRLILGATGVSYDVANRIFSMVILQIHLALIWGALARKYKGWGIGGAAITGLLIGLISQILIFGGTAASYILGADTYFTNPLALQTAGPAEFGQAMMVRAQGLLINCLLSAVAAALGFALAFLIPPRD